MDIYTLEHRYLYDGYISVTYLSNVFLNLIEAKNYVLNTNEWYSGTDANNREFWHTKDNNKMYKNQSAEYVITKWKVNG